MLSKTILIAIALAFLEIIPSNALRIASRSDDEGISDSSWWSSKGYEDTPDKPVQPGTTLAPVTRLDNDRIPLKSEPSVTTAPSDGTSSFPNSHFGYVVPLVEPEFDVNPPEISIPEFEKETLDVNGSIDRLLSQIRKDVPENGAAATKTGMPQVEKERTAHNASIDRLLSRIGNNTPRLDGIPAHSSFMTPNVQVSLGIEAKQILAKQYDEVKFESSHPESWSAHIDSFPDARDVYEAVLAKHEKEKALKAKNDIFDRVSTSYESDHSESENLDSNTSFDGSEQPSSNGLARGEYLEEGVNTIPDPMSTNMPPTNQTSEEYTLTWVQTSYSAELGLDEDTALVGESRTVPKLHFAGHTFDTLLDYAEETLAENISDNQKAWAKTGAEVVDRLYTSNGVTATIPDSVKFFDFVVRSEFFPDNVGHALNEAFLEWHHSGAHGPIPTVDEIYARASQIDAEDL